MDWSQDGSKLAVITQDNLTVYDEVLTPLASVALPDNISRFSVRALISPDGSRMILGRQILDSTTLQPIIEITDPIRLYSGQWGRDGTEVAYRGVSASRDRDNEMRFYSSVDGRLLRVFSSLNWQRSSDDVESYIWSPNGRYFYARGGGNAILILDAEKGTLVSQHQIDTDTIFTASWSPDSTKLALATTKLVELNTPGSIPETGMTDKSRLNSILILDIASGNVLTKITSSARYIVWHPEGTQIAGTDYQGELSIWDSATGVLVKTYSIPSSVELLQYSPYGGRLMVGIAIAPDTQSMNEDIFARSWAAQKEVADGLIQFFTPDASTELLDTIEAACVPAKAIAKLPSAEMLMADTTTAEAYVQAVQADTSIPAGCAADLIAVAEALQDEQESR